MEYNTKIYSINENNRNSIVLIDPRYEFDAPRYFDFSSEYQYNTT